MEQKQILEYSTDMFQHVLNTHFQKGWSIVPATTVITCKPKFHYDGLDRRIPNMICTATIQKPRREHLTPL